jgi:hypothetical protein
MAPVLIAPATLISVPSVVIVFSSFTSKLVLMLRLGDGDAPEDGVGVLDERQTRLGRLDAALRALDQLSPDLALEQRDLSRHPRAG